MCGNSQDVASVSVWVVVGCSLDEGEMVLLVPKEIDNNGVVAEFLGSLVGDGFVGKA